MSKTILLQAAAQGSQLPSLLLMGGIAIVFYFFILRPQQKKQKEQKKLVQGVKRGDNVITIGGIYGKVVSTDETTVTLEIDKGAKMKLLKSSISSMADSGEKDKA